MTARQFYFAIVIFIITLKIQKFPCLVYQFLDKDSVLLIVIFAFIELFGVIFAFYLAKLMKKNNLSRNIGSGFYSVLLRVCMLLISLYFFMQSMLFYEAIQDLFAHVLFDNLSWTLFSLFLVFAIFYLASSGLKIIGRNYEIYFGIIVVSLIILSMLGAMHTDFTNIFPLQTLLTKDISHAMISFNMWFGDFVIIFFLAINSNKIKLKYTLLSYIGAMAFVVFVCVEFYGIFYNYSAMQPSLISIISEQSLLGMDIGRFDWFCILITEVGTLLCSALCLCLAGKGVKSAFPKLNKNIVLFVFSIALYLIDVLYLVDTNSKEFLFLNFADIYSLCVKIIVFLGLMVVNLHFFVKNKNKDKRREYEKIS